MTIGKRPRSEIWVVLSPLVQKIDKRQPGFSGGYLMSNKLRSDASPSIEPGDWQEHNVSGLDMHDETIQAWSQVPSRATTKTGSRHEFRDECEPRQRAARLPPILLPRRHCSVYDQVPIS
ncbi:predicted protein [Plenodomus lingam JN3]|uniref:Predicted protein n=1 Tax=Leptosphaeria maculans (strain JN3 / isolate v23.1.3 / race Av1-4-5-6-7-8) TaxID=985895 RepID=E5A3R2_LEPMJ|nr:predicted protein [Plenodomus lingam JN3]CBX98275.1 predicted protein [Plenodomus lingam JN3]